MKEQTSRFQVNLENLERIGAFISAFMKDSHLSDEQIHDFEISVDEHFSNLVEHAFRGNTEEEVTITCREDEEKAQVIIADTSEGFDPRHYCIPDVEGTPIYELPPGGFGNYFICELMDEVNYIHRPHVNNELILTLYKSKKTRQNKSANE